MIELRNAEVKSLMHRVAIFFLCTFSCLCFSMYSLVARAQATPPISGDTLARLADPNFSTMGLKDGLPHDSVYGFAQDKRGAIWIATFGGLARFDGYTIRTYTHDSVYADSIPDNNVRGVLARSDGGLWVATGNAGIVSYDPRIDGFRPLPNQPGRIAKCHVFAMTEDTDGSLWFGSEVGLTHFMPKTGTYQIYGIAVKDDHSGLHQKSVFAILRSRNGDLWVGGDHGADVLRRGASQFEAENELLFPGAPAPPVWTVFEDARGQLWIGTDRAGIRIYDPAQKNAEGVISNNELNALIGTATVRGVVEVSPQRFWIATYGSGVIAYDAHSSYARQYKRDLTSPAPLSNNFVRGLFKDSSKNVWIGTDHGLSRLGPLADGLLTLHTSPLRRDGLSGNEVRSVTLQNECLWVGFDQGKVSVIDGNGQMHSVHAAPGVSQKETLQREVLAVKGDEREIFVGGVGLFVVDSKTYSYRPVHGAGLDGQVINALWVSKQFVWVGTYNGLVRYDRNDHSTLLFSHHDDDPRSLADNYVRDLLQTPDGTLWVTTRLGLDEMPKGLESFLHLRKNAPLGFELPSNNVQPIALDAGMLWVGSIDKGLLYQSGTRTVFADGATRQMPVFRDMDTTSGFPSNTVLTVMVGRDHRIWSNTPKGLAVVDPRTRTVKTFTEADGFRISSQNLFGSAAFDDGTLVFPGDQGLAIVRTDRIPKNPTVGNLFLSELAITGRKESAVAQAWGVQSLGVTPRIEMTSRERSFRAVFATLNVATAREMHYSYKLEGFDADWMGGDEGSHIVTYTNLPPGRYRLLVRAWRESDREAVSSTAIMIHIRPLFTETKWFKVLMLAAMVAVIFLAFWLRLQVIERRRFALEQLVKERTGELANKHADLLEANKRLEVLAKRDELTGAFNRRHFLEAANSEFERCVRSGRSFSLLLIDLDNFKRINDLYGHAAGDAALLHTIASLNRELRSTDVLARYGGEEFAVLLPESDDVNAEAVGERLRQQIAATEVVVGELRFSITASVGVSSRNGADSVDEILRRADVALYNAKAYGRNQVVRFSDNAEA